MSESILSESILLESILSKVKPNRHQVVHIYHFFLQVGPSSTHFITFLNVGPVSCLGERVLI